MTDFFTNNFSQEVWKQKYQLNDTTVDDTWRRNAQDLASIEDNKDYWAEQFYSVLKDFQFVPGGRIISNAGAGFEGTTYINCSVHGFTETDQDSIQGIYRALTEQALILKSECGYGFCCDVMRPRGTQIKGIGNQTPGAVKFLELWDKSSEIITAGSGKKSNKGEKKFIRKGAQMVTMSCWHPDILEFIEVKQQADTLTKCNMSIVLSDGFMHAVEQDADWQLIFPDIENYKEEYKTTWDGNILAWLDNYGDESVKVHATIKAKTLWDLIIKNSYNRAEPGVLFGDTINRMNNLWYCEFINSTNPCIAEGELVNTPSGYTPIERLKIGDYVTTVLGKEPIKSIEKNSDVDIYEVRFSDGGLQRVTAGHIYHSHTNQDTKRIDKKRLDQLRVKDRVCICRSYYADDKEDILIEQYNTGLKAGILIGDGCYTNNILNKNTIKIASNIDDNEYNNNIKELFGIENFRKDCISSISKSINMILSLDDCRQYINSIGLQPAYSYEKYINERFLNCKSISLGFLCGLLCTDGNVNLKSNHPQIRWMTSSFELAQQIRRTLLYFGAHGFINESNDVGSTINGREIIRQHSKFTVTISGESVRNFLTYILECPKLIHPDKYEKLLKCATDYRLSGNNWTAKIESIEKCDETTNVYDIFCEKSDTWITSGYVQQGCGEQVGPVGLTCLLGSINLVHFIDESGHNWNYKKLQQFIPIIIRMMDNVNDISYMPLPLQKDNMQQKRRIGMGVMGFSSAMMLMGIKYGSKRCVELIDELMACISNTAYQSSALLAKEKGCFALFDEEKYLSGKFIQSLDKKTLKLIKKYGVRNSHLLSIQPTGNTAVLANVVSSSIEPIFDFGYYRTSIQSETPEGLDVPRVNWSKKTFKSTMDWQWIKEGDEDLLSISFNDKVWKFDKNRGLLKEEWCEDYAITKLKSEDKWNPDVRWAVCTKNLTVDDHITVLKTFIKHVDSSISKTVNVPNNYPIDDFSQMYIDAWKSGVKGLTVYREGTMANVLSSISSSAGIIKTDAVKRPRKLDCDVFLTSVKGTEYFVLVGLVEDEPYEVFAGRSSGLINRDVKKGKIHKVLRPKGYRAELEDGTLIAPITLGCTDEQETITRLVSMSLRHGAKIEFVQDQLSKVSGEMTNFAKSLSRALKHYLPENLSQKCPECSGEMRIQSGCFSCIDCGYSVCT
jgi:ribonucleoside-diphosphate reductase alpha chain